MAAPTIDRINDIFRKDSFWSQWMLRYTFGELLGIGSAAVICRLLLVEFSDVIIDYPSYVTSFVLAMSGLAEGWIIGYLQWRSLSKLVANLGKRVWVLITMISMITGWLLIIPPAIFFISFFIDFSMEGRFYTFVSTAIMGLSFGGIVSAGQYFVLKKFYNNSLVWIPANVIGWMVSFLVVYLTLALMKHTHNPLVNILLMIMACIVSGIIQGVLSGLSLRLIMSSRKAG